MEVTGTDSIQLLNGDWRKTIELTCVNWPDFKFNWIEGVGDRDLGLLSPLSYCETDYPTQLRCHFENEDLLYSNPAAEECWLTGVDDLPIVMTAIYPNPCKETITFSTKISGKAKGNLYTLDGKLVKTFDYTNQQIDVSDLTVGMYVLKVVSGKNAFVGQFIKQ